MKDKIFLEEFVDKLAKMLGTSKTDEQKNACINYIENYKLQLKEVIDNDLFRDATLNYLDELIEQINNEGDNKIYEETNQKEIL